MLKVLFLGKNGDSFGLANKLAYEGMRVEYYTDHERCLGWSKSQNQVNPKPITNWRTAAARADITLLDSPGFGDIVDELTTAGGIVLGGSRLVDKLMRSPNKLTDLTALTEASPIQELDLTKQHVTINTGGWFSGSDWLSLFIHSVKYGSLMEGDKGPNAQMGDLVWLTDIDAIIKATFLPLTEFFAKSSYKGFVCINTILTSKDIYITGLLTGLDFDSVHTLWELKRNFWTKLLEGYTIDNHNELQTKRRGFSACVRLSLPPFPYAEPSHYINDHVRITEPKALPHIHKHPFHVCITAKGETVNDVQKRIYRTINSAQISRIVQYRRDIGRGYERLKYLLNEWGWTN
jgi:hypothetical protein